MSNFASRAGIEARFDQRWTEAENAFDNAILEAPQACKHVVQGDQLGLYLTALATALRDAPEGADRPTQANCLLLTATHAMALQVERKHKDGVDYFTAKVYDPNNTASYKRVEKLEPEGLSSLTIKDLLIRPKMADQYGAYADTPLAMVAVSLDHRVQPPMDRKAPAPTAANMRVALADGATDALEALLQSAQGRMSKADFFSLLRAKCHKSLPGMHLALYWGHADTVRHFVETVLNADELSANEKVRLLEAKDGEGMTGLFAAFKKGHIEAMNAFVQTVLNSDALDSKQKAHLLLAKDGNGYSGMFQAIRQRDMAGAWVFVHAVLNSDALNGPQKLDLLASKRVDGMSGWIYPFANGHTDMIEMLTAEVLKSKGLTPSEKVALLKAPDIDGAPGFLDAFKGGHTDTVKVFTDMVLQSDDLSPKQKIELLQAKGGLRATRQAGHTDTVNTFEESVRRSDTLDQSQKDALLN